MNHQVVNRHVIVVATLTLCLCAAGLQAKSPPDDGLLLWLDASDVAGDGGDAAQPAVGSPIQRWSDKSGRANHVEQLDHEQQPTVERGLGSNRPVIRFDGNDLLARDTFAGVSYRDQPLHVVVVMQTTADGAHAQPRLFELQPVDGDLTKPTTVKQHGFWIGQGGDGRARLATHYGDEAVARSVAWDAQPHMMEIIYAGAQSWVHYIDGARDGAGLLGDRDFHGFTKDLRLAIGQHYGSTETDTYFQGDLAELLVYDRRLSAEEQNTLKTYLSQKWSLDLSILPVPEFAGDVLPILTQYCLDCHGEDVQESDVDLRTVAAMTRGGKNGPLIARHRPEFSALVQLIAEGGMPPDDAERPDVEEIDVIRRWIEAGAPTDEKVVRRVADDWLTDEDRQFWAFKPLARHKPPKVNNTQDVRSPIDSFVLDKLEPLGLSLARPADRRTLVRRVHFDLIGLPPTPDDVDAFVADERPDAYERLLDRLLASPHFGQRWGRSWLDWAGYVDVYGKDNDFAIIKPLEGRWRYRDYVIDSLNDDIPLDRFLVEQLAGDELVDWRNAERYTPEIVQRLTATGFLLCSDDDTDQNELNTPDIRHHVLQNTGEIVANHLFALTLQCAKCHNHKYEAISQVDYYSWLANFAPVFNPQRWVTSVEHGIPDVSPSERQAIDAHNGEIDRQVDELNKQRDDVHEQCRQRVYAENLASLPEAIRTDVQSALETAAENRDEVQQYLADKFAGYLDVSDEQITATLDDAERSSLADIDAQLAALNADRRSYGTIQVAVEQSPPSETYLLRRGEVTKPGVEVQPASLSVLTPAGGHDPSAATEAHGASSGRRLALARRVTNPDTTEGALVVRVLVNRLWQELLGRGIVATSDNFGVSGARPTHPQLLDWLATQLVDGGWRIKPLIKSVMMSSVYRQASDRSDVTVGERVDPANDFLWRARLRRLEAELVRDRVLCVSGQLDRSLGGPPVPLLARPDGKIVVDMDALPTPTSHLRRSIYILNRRHYHLSMLTTFDQPFLTANCTYRRPSAVVTQALTMLNDDFVIEQAEQFAQRVIREADDASTSARVEKAYELALDRRPSDEERQWCVDLVHRQAARFAPDHSVDESLHQNASAQALSQLCHTLLNTSEFLYVE